MPIRTMQGNSTICNSGSQMVCKNLTAIGCRLQVMQNGARHSAAVRALKFSWGDVWAHQQCLLRRNGDNWHGCTPFHLETSVCQACKLQTYQRVSSGVLKRVVQRRCSKRKILNRYVAGLLTEKAAGIERRPQWKTCLSIEAAKVDTPEWAFQRIDFVAARRDAVAGDYICNKPERLIIHARKRDQILAAHVLRICEARDTVFRSSYQQIHRSSGADTTILIQNLREQVDV